MFLVLDMIVLMKKFVNLFQCSSTSIERLLKFSNEIYFNNSSNKLYFSGKWSKISDKFIYNRFYKTLEVVLKYYRCRHQWKPCSFHKKARRMHSIFDWSDSARNNFTVF